MDSVDAVLDDAVFALNDLDWLCSMRPVHCLQQPSDVGSVAVVLLAVKGKKSKEKKKKYY